MSMLANHVTELTAEVLEAEHIQTVVCEERKNGHGMMTCSKRYLSEVMNNKFSITNNVICLIIDVFRKMSVIGLFKIIKTSCMT